MVSTRAVTRPPARRASKGRPGAEERRLRSLKDPSTLAKFVRNLREGVYITTTYGLILDANPAFLRMFGVRSLHELSRFTAERLLVDPLQRDEELALLAEQGSVREFELELRRPDGEVRTVLDTAYQVTDPETGEIVYHGILVDITDRKALERELAWAAIRDALTGCYNRRYLADREREFATRESPWGVVIIDIDHFKEYNDRFGHDTGDAVLVRVARFLLGIVRSEDAVVRIGGDEFLILLEDGSSRATAEVVQRLRHRERKAVPVSLSCASAIREGAESLEATIRRADQKLIRRREQERRPRMRQRRATRAAAK